MIAPIAEALLAQATSGDLHSSSEAGAHSLALCDMTQFQVSWMLTQCRLTADILGILRLRRVLGAYKPAGTPRTSIPSLNHMRLTALKREKRRQQNRTAQAAFRQKKEQELTALRNHVKELLEERQGLLDLHSRIVRANDHMRSIVLGLDCGTLVSKPELPHS
jgi:hypothetical protein